MFRKIRDPNYYRDLTPEALDERNIILKKMLPGATIFAVTACTHLYFASTAPYNNHMLKEFGEYVLSLSALNIGLGAFFGKIEKNNERRQAIAGQLEIIEEKMSEMPNLILRNTESIEQLYNFFGEREERNKEIQEVKTRIDVFRDKLNVFPRWEP